MPLSFTGLILVSFLLDFIVIQCLILVSFLFDSIVIPLLDKGISSYNRLSGQGETMTEWDKIVGLGLTMTDRTKIAGGGHSHDREGTLLTFF